MQGRAFPDDWEIQPNLGKSPLPSPASSLLQKGPSTHLKCSTPRWVSPPLFLLRPIKRLLYISSSSCQGQLLYDCWFPRQITPISELMLKVHIGSAGIPAKHSSMEPEVRLCPALPAELLLFFLKSCSSSNIYRSVGKKDNNNNQRKGVFTAVVHLNLSDSEDAERDAVPPALFQHNSA